MHNQSEKYLRENLSTYTVCYAKKKVNKFFNLVLIRLSFFYYNIDYSISSLNKINVLQKKTELKKARLLQNIGK